MPNTVEPRPSPNEKAQLLSLIEELERARGSRVIVYWLTPMARISDAVAPYLYDQLVAVGAVQKLDLVVFTLGGDVEAPSRIITLLREFCSELAVLAPFKCSSAGTIIAMGADEIVMTPLSVLGPIDPTRSHPLLPKREGAPEAEPISVQDMRHAMQFIMNTAKPEVGGGYTAEAMAQIVTALFEKIHPLAIGAIEQSYALAKLVGRRCLETHMDPDTQAEEIKKIVDTLCDEYKSHAYQIGRQEARQIGLKVKDAEGAVAETMDKLLRFYSARPTWPSAQPRPNQTYVAHIGWLDSTAMTLRATESTRLDGDGHVEQVADWWETY